MDRDVRPYKQKGNTCAVVCMMMLLEYYGIITKADWQKERMYYKGFRSKYMEGTPFSAIAWFLSNNGLNVKMVHANKNLFDNSCGYIADNVFKLAVEEYKDYIDKALETGATIENGTDFDEKEIIRQLDNGKFVILAGMVNNYLHAILITGYDENHFIVCDPLYKEKQKRTFQEVEEFMVTPIGKWCLYVSKPKKMQLLLSGGGEPEQVKSLDECFANYVQNGKILYIPVAMDKIPYNECEIWFRKTYAKYNLNNIEMQTDLKKIKDLNKYKAIFIGGGNTFKLLKEVKESSFDQKITEYLNNGGFVYGGSAGAIIFGKTIKTAIHADKNNVNLKDLTGLNLLNGYDVWCHYNENNDKNDIMKLSNKTLVLYEESGILYDGESFKKLGTECLIYPDSFN